MNLEAVEQTTLANNLFRSTMDGNLGDNGLGGNDGLNEALQVSLNASNDVYETPMTASVPVAAFSYDEVFPALPESTTIDVQQSNLGQWNERMKVNLSVITQVFSVPVEERRYREFSNQEQQQFGTGGIGEQSKVCADISQKTGAHIEISSAKDQSLTILVTGKQNAVAEARRLIVNALQTQAVVNIPIPKEHHRFLLGKSGKRLKELEISTSTKISVPRPEDNSEQVRIVGTKENIDKARHEIQLISDEQAKLAFERLNIERIYHPFISGPHGEQVNNLAAETGARINIPPHTVYKDEITVAGDKDGVMKAKEFIMNIYEEKRRKCQTVQINVRKSQHKHIIGGRGSGIHDILAQTGVSVEIPPLESSSDTITLRGEQDKLGPALTLVYEKANSIVNTSIDAPSWLHKYIIGRKGANIRQLTQDYPKVHVEFSDSENKIKFEGPPAEVDQAQKTLMSCTNELISRLSYKEVDINPKYHKHIIGKNGANVNRIKQETGVLIHIPSEDGCETIRIEGDAKGVATARAELLELAKKMENERSKDIIIDQSFHRSIIGAKGESIREIRERFNQVNITFPDPGTKSDVVTIRGPQKDVDGCYRHLMQLTKELTENSYKEEVPIDKQFHKYIIGKSGANIKKIRDETYTNIDLPAEGSESDVIVITGKRSSVEIARDRILAIQNEQYNIVQVDIIIPSKYHTSIIGAKGRLIKSIMDECGGISIHFPKEGSNSDKVTLRGDKDHVDKAKKQLLELANEKEMSGHSAEIKAKRDHHRFLIGRNGMNIRRLRDKTGARIIFPAESGEDSETIKIVGTLEAVRQAKEELEALIQTLDSVVETEVHIDPKYHRHFVARRGQVLRNIADEYGGVTVSFPQSESRSDVVTLKGSSDCVEGAKQRLLKIVNDLEQMVTIECFIPRIHHRAVMGAKGFQVRAVTETYDVQIKFPDRDQRDEYPTDFAQQQQQQPNGDYSQEDINCEKPMLPVEFDSQNKLNIIRITGRKENCENAKAALLALIPITVSVEVPFEFHRYIIGSKGVDVRNMNKDFNVNISVPPAMKQSDTIEISGLAENVENAKQEILKKVESREKELIDRQLRSYTLSVEVDPKYHPKIIGRKGDVINKIRMTHEVNIQLPDRNNSYQNVITITGYEKNAEAAREAILDIVRNLEEMVSENVRIDHRVHSRIIGARGRNIRKLMEEYKVDVRFPRDTENEDPDVVIISGLDPDVQQAKEYLLNMEEEYLQDVNEAEMLRSYTQAPSRHQDEDNRPRNVENKGFVVKGGPWEQRAPDTSSSTEFPSFGSSKLRGGKDGGGHDVAGGTVANDAGNEASARPIFWGPRH